MNLIVISPESQDPRELEAIGGLFDAGLGRYHVRKPSWSAAQVEAWLRTLPGEWLARIVLHRHPDVASRLGLAGFHERDAGPSLHETSASRSFHDLGSLRASIRLHPYVFFGPVFPSLTKRGHAPAADFPWSDLAEMLGNRPRRDAAKVYAIGGVTEERLPRCRELGFDGAALLGAVWLDADPVRAYVRLRAAADKPKLSRHAA